MEQSTTLNKMHRYLTLIGLGSTSRKQKAINGIVSMKFSQKKGPYAFWFTLINAPNVK